MKLDENYRIEADTHNWVLHYEEKKVNKDSKAYTAKDHWYFPTIQTCFKKWCDETLKDSKSIEDLKSKMDALNKKIDGLRWEAPVTN